MTGAELALILIKKYPNHEVTVDGYEEGYTSNVGVEEIKILKNSNTRSWSGEHTRVNDLAVDIEPFESQVVVNLNRYGFNS